jgi:hypothetical protein
MVPFKRAPFAFFFLFLFQTHETASFWPKRAVSFKRKLAPKRVIFQISPQFMIYSIKSSIAILILKIKSITSLPNSIVDPEVGRLFHFGPWSLIYAIWPSIDQ